MKPLQLSHIFAIFFCTLLQILVAQASSDSSKLVFSTLSCIQGRATIQESSFEQLLPRKYLQSYQEFIDDKMRLGSTPPSCHNKCNACNPCTAIQVPTLPNHAQVLLASQGHPSPSAATGGSKKYSNYKPMGWKCKCGNHFFNP